MFHIGLCRSRVLEPVGPCREILFVQHRVIRSPIRFLRGGLLPAFRFSMPAYTGRRPRSPVPGRAAHSRCQRTLWNQFLGDVNRKSLAIAAAIQGVARMAHSTGARRAVLADARALPQRQRSSGYRRKLLDRGMEPSDYLLWSLEHVRVSIYTRTLYGPIKSVFNGFVWNRFCTPPGHRLIQIPHFWPVDGSNRQSGLYWRLRILRLAGADRPTDGSVRGQSMIQVTAFRFLCRRETCRGNRQSRTQARAGRVGSSAAGALDTGLKIAEN